jgi:hypothetical protein
MSREINIIIGDGEVTALAGGPLSLADLGPRTTRRVSRVEFNGTTNLWEVLDPVDRAAAPLFTNADYDLCLQWEAAHFNALLGTNPDSVIRHD